MAPMFRNEQLTDGMNGDRKLDLMGIQAEPVVSPDGAAVSLEKSVVKRSHHPVKNA